MPYSFAAHLSRFGPGAHYATPDLAAARGYCARLTRNHYENFSVASLFLPRPLLKHFHPVYAYCRWADDLGDETGGGERAVELLRWWRGELLAMYAGRTHHPVMVALKPTVEQFRIPPEPFLDLLSAFEQDQSVKDYLTHEQLRDYCRRSANPVGRLVLHLCESFDEEKARLSDHICTGLQLANFWQDVRRDWTDLGRVYLPKEDRERFGVPDADLHEGRFTPAFRDLMTFEVARARECFELGRPLIDQLPGIVRQDIRLFREGGLAILRKIEAVGYDVLTDRPRLSKAEKARLMMRVLFVRPPKKRSIPDPVLRSFLWCHRLAKATAKNFYPTFLVLPRPQRRAMDALYAFMRVTDDLADEAGDVEVRRLALKQWRTGLDRCLAGDFRHPLHPALHATVRRYRIDPRHLHEVIDGVEMDLASVRFETFADLDAYCYRVASAVGLCCIAIWGCHDPRAFEAAHAAGLALQLTNILRDLKEDMEQGRVYLPEEDLESFRCPPAEWSAASPKFQTMMRFQVERARGFYRKAETLDRYLPPAGRAIFRAMVSTYRGLLEEIARRNFDVFRERVRLPGWRKLLNLALAFPVRWGWG